MANKWAYYNEIDPHAAAWIRELIKGGHIADGVVDERSIVEVDANDVRGFLQCHWFAGIAGWSRALRLAGVSDDTPIWTGSCPCQPFSSAGKGEGLNDPRHLWPHFFRIISYLRPTRVVGEQVASPDALVWWDAVCADLEGAGYAGWAADLCSAGIGAPHIRQRLYWVADAGSERRERRQGAAERSFCNGPHAGRIEGDDGPASGCQAGGGLAYSERHGDRGQAEPADHQGPQADRSTDQRGRCGGASGGLADAHQVGREPLSSAGQPGQERDAEPRGGVRGMADAEGAGWREERQDAGWGGEGNCAQGWASGHGASSSDCRPRPLDGIRRDADWLHCRDGKWRPVKPGLVPLVDGLPRGVVPSSRVGMAFDADKTAEARAMRLKGYGNAIDPELAAIFLKAIAL